MLLTNTKTGRRRGTGNIYDFCLLICRRILRKAHRSASQRNNPSLLLVHRHSDGRRKEHQQATTQGPITPLSYEDLRMCRVRQFGTGGGVTWQVPGWPLFLYTLLCYLMFFRSLLCAALFNLLRALASPTI